MHEVDGAFAGGDYLSAVRQLSPDSWQYWASLGLIGHPADAAGALARFTHPDAMFFSGVASWIAGDDDRARHVLGRCENAHARRLLNLIVKHPITVLAQLPWNRRGPWDILTHLKDPAFRLLNVSFHPDDIHNQLYADVRTLIPAGVQPDFYAAEMLEWHLIPPNIRTLGCPVLGHSSDFDLHIQTVAPWLELFDELVVLDHVEWRGLSGAVAVPVSVFPKVFGVPSDFPDLPEGHRDIDVFLSGTVMHPYHDDKEAIVLDVLDVPDARTLMVQGFEEPPVYYKHLSKSKLCCTFIRHAGALPTRGLEALGLGCVVAVQEESVLRLFVDDREGVVSYGPGKRLSSVIQEVLQRSDEFLAQARRGAEFIRREFALERVASQYFRFLTFLAARPRRPREDPPPERMLQKRPVVQKGWLPSSDFGKGLLMDWAARSAARIEERLEADHSVGLLNDLARERLLAHYHDDVGAGWLRDAIAPLERAMEACPDALVVRFNLVRALLHFGDPVHVRQGIGLVDTTLDASAQSWRLHPLDDVLPWDFCPSFFNYRRYFDTVTRSLASADSDIVQSLIAIILAALNHYRSRYATECPGPHSELFYAEQAVRLDPGFAEYILNYARLLVRRGLPADLSMAKEQLSELSRRSTRLIEIHDIARQLPDEAKSDWCSNLEARASRLWWSTRVRENLPHPTLRSSLA